MKSPVHKIFSLAIVFLASCSTAQKDAFNKSHSINFQRIVELRDRNPGSAEIIETLGNPGLRRGLGPKEELWVYFETDQDGSPAQRLTILFDPTKDKADTWSWIVRSGEHLADSKNFQNYFGGNFTFKKETRTRQTSNHSWDKETTVTIQKTGVSALLHNSGNIFVISMDAPTDSQRSIAERQN